MSIYLPFISYFAFLIFAGRYAYVEGENHRYYKAATFGVAVFVAAYALYYVGLRPLDSYGDTIRYVWAYEGLTSFDDAAYQGKIYFGNEEWLFWRLSYVLNFLGFSPQAWLASMVLIPGAIIGYCYRELLPKGQWIVVFAVLYMSYYVVFCGAIRQAVAESLVLLSFVQSLKKKYIYSILLSILAVGFHQSAIVSIIFPILALMTFNLKVVLIAVVMAVFFSTLAVDYMVDLFDFVGIGSIADKLTIYTTGDGGEFGNLFQHKQFLLLFVVAVIYLYLMRGRGGIYNYLFYMVFLIFFFWAVPVMSGRMMGYITIIFPILVHDIFGRYFSSSNLYYIYVGVFGFLGFFVLSVNSTQLVLGLK